MKIEAIFFDKHRMSNHDVWFLIVNINVETLSSFSLREKTRGLSEVVQFLALFGSVCHEWRLLIESGYLWQKVLEWKILSLPDGHSECREFSTLDSLDSARDKIRFCLRTYEVNVYQFINYPPPPHYFIIDEAPTSLICKNGAIRTLQITPLTTFSEIKLMLSAPEDHLIRVVASFGVRFREIKYDAKLGRIPIFRIIDMNVNIRKYIAVPMGGW